MNISFVKLCVITWSLFALCLTTSQAKTDANQIILEERLSELKLRGHIYNFEYATFLVPKAILGLGDGTVSVVHVRYDESVFFEFNKYDLNENAKKAIEDLAETLNSGLTVKSVVVVGHTDSVGSNAYNAILSKQRASNVAQTIIQMGLEAEFVSSVPMGEIQPIATNASVSGRSRNRRVEFFLSQIHAASLTVIERIPFDPCFRDDHDKDKLEFSQKEDCEHGDMEVPILDHASTNSTSRRKLLIGQKQGVGLIDAKSLRPLIFSTDLKRPVFGDFSPYPNHEVNSE